MFRTIILIIFSIWGGGLFNAIGASTPTEKASELYKVGKYEQAAVIYDSISRADGTSAALLFNLGNTYVKLDKLGPALTCYLKARKLAPSNSTIRSNILYLEAKVQDRNRAFQKNSNISVEPESPNFLTSLRQHISSRVHPDTWGIMAIIAFSLTLIGVVLYVFTKMVKVRKTGFFSAIFFLFLTLLFNIFAYISHDYWTNNDFVVIIPKQVKLLNAPANDAKPVAMPLVSGTLLKIIHDDATPKGWYKVKLNANYEGYLPDKDVSII